MGRMQGSASWRGAAFHLLSHGECLFRGAVLPRRLRMLPVVSKV